jgi:serine protease
VLGGRIVKRKHRIILWLLVILALIVLFMWIGRQTGPGEAKVRSAAPYARVNAGDPDVVPLTLLVDFRDHADPAALGALQRRTGLAFALDSYAPGEQIFRATARSELELQSALELLRGSDLVEAAEREVLYGIPPLAPETPSLGGSLVGPEAAGFPNDPQYKYQWHLRQVRMPEAWKLGQGEGVVVAVIDTGVKRVSDLKGTELVGGWNFVARNANAEDDHGHGTHVAGTIAQTTNNGVGVAGIAYRAKIMPLKVLSARGFGRVGDIADAIRYAADHGAKVINMSLGGGSASKVLERAVKYAHDKGVVVVCAAGNEGRRHVSYPAAYPGAIAVAATQVDESTTFYSNYGPQVDVAAPGGNTKVDQNGDGKPDGVLQNTILPTDHTKDDYLFFMGTSMAAPHVSGVAALIVAAGVTAPDAVEKVLKASARHPGHVTRDERYGAGIIDAAAALKKVKLQYGMWQLGLAGLIGALVVVRLRQRGCGIRLGSGWALGLLVGSSGLFFLPWLGLGRVPGMSVLAQGFPAWDHALLGPRGHANAVFYSALGPILLAGLLYGVARLRGLISGFALGVAAHLMFYFFWNVAVLRWMPGFFGLGELWLFVNGLLAAGLGYLVARR